jgi:hypothetical protein
MQESIGSRILDRPAWLQEFQDGWPRFSAFARMVVLMLCVTSCTDDAAYRAWVEGRIQSSVAADTAETAVIAMMWRQQLCDRNHACLASETKRKLFELAHQRAADQPALLVLLADIGYPYARPGENITRWKEIAQADPRNALPLAVIAAQQWNNGDHEAARATLQDSVGKPDFNDYLPSISAAIERSVAASPPTRQELAPCSEIGEEFTTEPGVAQRVGAATSEVISVVLMPYIGDILTLCKATENDRVRREGCASLGTNMDERATNLVTRNTGLTLLLSATDDIAAQKQYMQRQADNLDELLRTLWWVGSPSSHVREEATALWLDEFARSGEFKTAAALLKKFGDPPHESRATREARFDETMAKGRACYARRFKATGA